MLPEGIDAMLIRYFSGQLTESERHAFEAWIAEARAAGRFAFDTETTSLDAMQAEFVGFSMAVAPNRACYVPLGHRVGNHTIDFRGLTQFVDPIKVSQEARAHLAGGGSGSIHGRCVLRPSST